MNLREILKKYIGNNQVVRKLLYLHRSNPERLYQICHHTSEKIPHDVKRDMYCALLNYGCAYDEYFYFGFESNKDKTYRNNFITEAKRFYYFQKLNKYKNLYLFDNKLATYKVYGKYYERDIISLITNSVKENELVRLFVQSHPGFVAKKSNASCGQGVQYVDSTKWKDPKILLENLISDGYDLAEELIIQSSYLSILHPRSVNTIRITTILTGSDPYDVFIFHPFLKIGQGDSFVDNGGAGGVIIKIDPITGILCTDGCDEANIRYKVHPDSGVKLKGFQLPDWSQAVSLAKELALITPSNRYTGWDFAHTDKGWILVEANARGQFVGQQMCDVVGKRAELDEIMKYIPDRR